MLGDKPEEVDITGELDKEAVLKGVREVILKVTVGEGLVEALALRVAFKGTDTMQGCIAKGRKSVPTLRLVLLRDVQVAVEALATLRPSLAKP